MTDRISRSLLSNIAPLALLLLLPASAALSVTIPGDPADGQIRLDTGTVNTGSVEISIGHRGSNATELATGIYLFELPDLAAGEVSNAALSYSWLDRSGSFATNPPNADIWGLGFVSTTAIATNWHLLGNADARTGADLGTGIGANAVVKLADNHLSNIARDPGADGEPYRMALAAPALSDFLNLCYSEGAVSGDYAVIRVNVDESSSAVSRGFDLASADATELADRPVLSINEHTILLYDPFEDGTRSNGVDALDTDWIRVTDTDDSQFLLEVTSDNAGTGSGDALFVQMIELNSRFLGGFPEVTLEDPGDFIQLTLAFRPSFVLGNTNAETFRLALLNSLAHGGSTVTNDTGSVSSAAHYSGYMVRMSTAPRVGRPAALGLTQSNQYNPQSFLGGSGTNLDFMARDDDAILVSETVLYELTYTVTRVSSTQMAARVVLNDAVVNGYDPGTDSDAHDWAFSETFDAIGWGCNGSGGDAVDFTVDDIRVESNVPLVAIVPHEEVMVEAVETVFETQADIEYNLQQATDLVTPNWVGTGYRLRGDGGELRAYDPAPADPGKSYRLGE